MGHQQLLLTLLAISVVGIMISVGIITIQDALEPDNRLELLQDLRALAGQAQQFYKRPLGEGGGEGTFIGLASNAEGIKKLSARPSTTHGDFFIRRAGNIHTVELLAVGVDRGLDPRYPIRMSITVWPESTSIRILN